MKKLAIYLAAAGLGLGIVRPAFAAEDKAAEMEILQIEKTTALAKNVNDAMFAHDPKFTLFDLMPPVLHGYDAVKKHFTDLFAALPDGDVHIVWMNIRADDEFGFANSTQRLTLKDKTGKVTLDTLFRVTDCYHKVDGKWLMLFQHNSFPVDLATGKAVFATK